MYEWVKSLVESQSLNSLNMTVSGDASVAKPMGLVTAEWRANLAVGTVRRL